VSADLVQRGIARGIIKPALNLSLAPTWVQSAMAAGLIRRTEQAPAPRQPARTITIQANRKQRKPYVRRVNPNRNRPTISAIRAAMPDTQFTTEDIARLTGIRADKVRSSLKWMAEHGEILVVKRGRSRVHLAIYARKTPANNLGMECA
jgi:hypothetical protein